jgi:hypothetical protein
MSHPQNSPRGLFAKGRVHVGSAGVFFTGYSTTSALLDANSTSLKVTGGIQVSGKSTSKITGNTTGIVLAGGVRFSNKSTAVVTGNSTGIVLVGGILISNKRYIKANSTSFAFGSTGVISSTRNSTAKWQFVKTVAGTGAIAVNTTGTTWKYCRMTSKLNST